MATISREPIEPHDKLSNFIPPQKTAAKLFDDTMNHELPREYPGIGPALELR